MLLTDGVDFKAVPATLALPAQSGSYPFMLLGTPEQPGQLNIKGIICFGSFFRHHNPLVMLSAIWYYLYNFKNGKTPM